MSEEKKNLMIKAASLWRGTTKDGNEYFAGNWGSVRVLIFAARTRKGPKSPDYYMFLAERQEPAKPADQGARPAPDDEPDSSAV